MPGHPLTGIGRREGPAAEEYEGQDLSIPLSAFCSSS
jgi:hypothetical protein